MQQVGELIHGIPQGDLAVDGRSAPGAPSEEPARRTPTEKAELAGANAHFSVGLQLRRIERSRSE
ncbi:hypothetical protein AB691_2888 [Stutzerimonas stutzeri]|nr:hypothetical protein AB691_2888 [Stutzerimonas stutzeri]